MRHAIFSALRQYFASRKSAQSWTPTLPDSRAHGWCTTLGWSSEAPCSTARHGKHFEERCGYGDKNFSNGSAGVSIPLKNF